MANLLPIIVAGPTAGGKSDIAESLCDVLDGVIINADSLQVYKGLPMLTAQPEIRKGRHLLYSIFDPMEKCDVVRWLTLVQTAINDAVFAGKRPIIVGGTGFYIKVLMGGIAPIPTISDAVIQHAEELVAVHGIQSLYDDLIERDPTFSPHIKSTDTHRIIRAWTVFEGTGRSLQDWYQLQTSTSAKFIKILCTHERDILYERINQRFASMWKSGILNEVQVFNSTYQNITENYAAKAIGFTEVKDFFSGKLSESQAITQAQTKSRQYAKRQLTWFRHQYTPDVVLEGPNFDVEAVLAVCRATETSTL